MKKGVATKNGFEGTMVSLFRHFFTDIKEFDVIDAKFPQNDIIPFQKALVPGSPDCFFKESFLNLPEFLHKSGKLKLSLFFI